MAKKNASKDSAAVAEVIATPAAVSPDKAIQVMDLRKTYQTGLFFKKDFEALRGVSFEVAAGEIFGLLGPNGAGKTTFIKVLLGIVKSSGGEAYVFGEPAGSLGARSLVGYLPENLAVPRHLNGYTALEYYGNLSDVPTATIKEKQEELLDLVGIADRAKDSVQTYSKGMRQRLGLAQALLHDPKVLVLDEPTDGLDPVARSQVRTILTGLTDRGVTIFLNSHILQEVEMICDRVAVLDRGKLRFAGAVKDINSFLQKQAGGADGGLEVTLELEGPAEMIAPVFDPASVISMEPTGQNEHRAVVRFADQAEVDKAVDQLRQAGVNIVGISRRKASLEDAFIQLITQPAENS